MRIVLASKNEGKIKEIKEIMTINGIEFLSYHDFDAWPDVNETKTTLKENAILKAEAITDFAGLPALADDSGLEVDILSGEPGVLSSRYAGPQSVTADNNARLLQELENTSFEERTARFRCVAVFAATDGTLLVAEGVCGGRITLEPKGSGGFGYDPLFVPDGYDKTIAELSPEEKNLISHRGKAFRLLKQKLEKLLQTAQT
jgi:non-canonical purine NTP pyrophosphatase (RdgB/HAM1 family)